MRFDLSGPLFCFHPVSNLMLQTFCRLTSLCFVLDPNSTTCPEMIGVLLSITSFFEEVVVVYSMISISVSSSWNKEEKNISRKNSGLISHTYIEKRLKIQNSAVLHEEISKWNWPKLFDWPKSEFFCILPMHSACAASLAASEAATAYSPKILDSFVQVKKMQELHAVSQKFFTHEISLTFKTSFVMHEELTGVPLRLRRNRCRFCHQVPPPHVGQPCLPSCSRFHRWTSVLCPPSNQQSRWWHCPPWWSWPPAFWWG